MSSDNLSSADNQQETQEISLDPSWVTGFVDGEGCFSISVHQNPMAPFGWQLLPSFQVSQHEDSVNVLNALNMFFGVGRVRRKSKLSNVFVFQTYGCIQLQQFIIPHFEKYPLVVKSLDFKKFKEVVQSIHLKKSRDYEEFIRLIKLVYSMNKNGKQRTRTIETILEDPQRLHERPTSNARVVKI
jgi:hypothetical protein